jgi:hypothetical protein
MCACLAAATLAGCRAPNRQDRNDDAAEILRLNVGLGPGLLVNAHATRCIAVGLGAYEARRYGFRNGYGWIWDERRYDTNLIIPIWGWEDVDAVARPAHRHPAVDRTDPNFKARGRARFPRNRRSDRDLAQRRT